MDIGAKNWLFGFSLAVVCLVTSIEAMHGKDEYPNQSSTNKLSGVLLFHVESNWIYSNATKFLLVKPRNSEQGYSCFHYYNQNDTEFGKEVPNIIANFFVRHIKYFSFAKLADLLDYSERSCTINNDTKLQKTVFLLNCSGLFKTAEHFMLAVCEANGYDGKFFTYTELKAAYDTLKTRNETGIDYDDTEAVVEEIDSNLLYVLFDDKKYNLQWLYENNKLKEMPVYKQ